MAKLTKNQKKAVAVVDINKEYSLISSGEILLLFCNSHGSVRQGRQKCMENGSLAKFAVAGDETATVSDDAVHNRQAHTGAFAHFLGGEIGFEDFIKVFRGDARSGIGNRKLDKGAGLNMRFFGQIFGTEVNAFQGDIEDAALLFHGMEGIGTQVDNNLVDLGRVGKDGYVGFFDILANFDRCRE